jgi:hypothetical protein
MPPQSHSIGGTEAKQESPHFWTPKRQGSRKFALPTLSRSKSEGDDGAITTVILANRVVKKQASMDMMLSTADDKQQAASIFQGGSSSNLMASLSCKQGGGKKRASMDMMLSTADDKQWEASIFQGGSSSNLMASLSCKQGGGKKRASMDMMLSTADDKQRAASIFQRDSSSNLMASLSSFSPNKPISLGLPATLPTSSTEGSEDDSFSSCSTSSSCSYSSSSSEEPIKNHTRRRRHPTEEPIPCHSSRPRRRSSLGNEEKPDNNRMSCKSKDLSAFCTPRRTSSRKLQMNGIPDDISITIEEAVEERRGKKSKKGKRSKKKKPKSGGESRSRHLRKSNRSGNGSRKYSSSSSLSAKGEPRTCREVPHRIPRHHKSTDDSLDNYRGSSPGGKRRPPSKDRSASLDNYRGSSHVLVNQVTTYVFLAVWYYRKIMQPKILILWTTIVDLVMQRGDCHLVPNPLMNPPFVPPKEPFLASFLCSKKQKMPIIRRIVHHIILKGKKLPRRSSHPPLLQVRRN